MSAQCNESEFVLLGCREQDLDAELNAVVVLEVS
jgi:hypothetical protein